MNDPWNTLVEVLAGRQRPTPSSWSQRRVHRMCDDAPAVRPAPRRPAPVLGGGAFVPPARVRLDPNGA